MAATGAYQTSNFAYQGAGQFVYQGLPAPVIPPSEISFFQELTEWAEAQPIDVQELVAARIFEALTQIPDL